MARLWSILRVVCGGRRGSTTSRTAHRLTSAHKHVVVLLSALVYFKVVSDSVGVVSGSDLRSQATAQVELLALLELLSAGAALAAT